MLRRLVLRLVINAVAVYAAAYVVDGISVPGPGAALGVAIILGVLNVFVRPLLLLITLPVNVLTLGLFTLVINGLILALAAWLTPALQIDTLWTAIVAALVISLINWVLGLAEED